MNENKNVLALILSLAMLSGCEGELARPAAADVVYLNARIYTVDDDRTWAEALAILDGRFAAVGMEADVSAWIGDSTEVVDLNGRMAMPGIFDLHVHAMAGGVDALFECSFSPDAAREQILGRVSECVANRPHGEWVIGGLFPEEWRFASPPLRKEELDAVAPDHPVFLMSSTSNTAWMNSRALSEMRLQMDTPDPEGGRYFRDDKTGELTGLLIEKAAAEVMRALPTQSAEQELAALRWTNEYLNSVGITGIMDAGVDGNDLRAFSTLGKSGEMTLWVALSLFMDDLRETKETFEEIKQNHRERINYQTEHVRTDFAKIFLDGVPMILTAAYLDPYLADEVHGDDYRGEFFYDDLNHVRDAVIEFDNQGVTVKMHAVGDAAVREGLNIIENVRQANSDSNLPHQISHASHVHPKDIDRFAELNAVPELSPTVWFPSFINEANAAAVGERTYKSYPIKNLVDAGALVTYGSDWLSAIQSANPWPGLEGMVTRKNPYDEMPGEMGPEQAVDLPTAIEIFTINGAKAMRWPDRTGSIEVGKSADMIVLDRNLFEVSEQEIGDTQVLLTLFAGDVVYDAEIEQ